MSDIRFAMLDQTSHVSNIIYAPSTWNYPYLIPSETAQMGDYWDGAIFITPVPPPPSFGDMAQALRTFLSNKETARQEAIVTTLIDNDPPETMSEFMARVVLADPS